MAKPNVASTTPKPPTVQAVVSAPVVAQAAPVSIDVSGLGDKELTTLFKQVQAERKARSAAQKASSLAVGTKVIVRDPKSKHVGKEAVVILSRKTRCFVQTPGILSPLYILTALLERVPESA